MKINNLESLSSNVVLNVSLIFDLLSTFSKLLFSTSTWSTKILGIIILVYSTFLDSNNLLNDSIIVFNLFSLWVSSFVSTIWLIICGSLTKILGTSTSFSSILFSNPWICNRKQKCSPE